MSKPVIAVVEKWTIPTYPFPPAEEMPMYAETRGHQGTSGNPYPNRVVNKVDRIHRADKEWEVVRLENDYIRVCMIPALGGRVFEAYDKKNDYHFLYRQHVIKPALIGAFGSWISGGIEFNWPFHHRPSTVLPVDYTIETEEDGTAICWMSECDPSDRTKGMVGIVLHPDASFFETRVKVTNRTATEHSFLWWENAAVRVHEQYRLIFPPDVTWAHHHYDRSHVTFPIAQSQYGAERFETPTDISWHKNTRTANSYFAAPSDFDFFGGYDYEKECGTIHIANHHISPGKKMFTWGYGANAENWEDALTDTDGPYAELMAGSYTDDQPDFTWLAPYETKCFSQYWYPTKDIKYVTFANLDAAIAVDKAGAESKVRLNVTKVVENGTFQVFDGEKLVLEEKVTIAPCECKEWDVVLSDEKYTVKFLCACGEEIASYTEITPDYVHIPKDNPGIPTPDKLHNAQDNYIAGLHIDQYRDPIYKPDEYYLEALKYDPRHLPSLIGMGEYLYRTGKVDEAVEYLEKALAVQNAYNTNPKDGTVSYLLGLCYLYQENYKKAYDTFYKATWSYNAIGKSMSFIAALDGRKGDYEKMLFHAEKALDKESAHPLAGPYAAYALWKLGKVECAKKCIDAILANDPLNQLARYIKIKVYGEAIETFYDEKLMASNPSQTCLDVAFDIQRAGDYAAAAEIFEGLKATRGASTMALYALGFAYEKMGECCKAKAAREEAAKNPIVEIFPYRLAEIKVLEAAVKANELDGTAWYLLGNVVYDKKHYAYAEECWKKATIASPDFYIPYRNLAVACYSHLGKQAEALEYQKKAVDLKPGDEQLLNEVSFLMASVGVPGEERAEYLKAKMPENAGDDMSLELAKAYNACGKYEESLQVMLGHTFTPGEGGEFAIAETYMYSRFAAGRKALKAGNYEEALAYFQAALKIPENLHAGFWNESVTVPYRYYEAEALDRLGRVDEAKAIIDHISKIDNRGMWNMGGEFTYYTAKIAQLAGDEMKARDIIRKAILNWEEQLADKRGAGIRQKGGRFFYLSFIDDPKALKEGNLYYMLAYAMLFNGEKATAKEYFEKSLALNPDNVKAELELSLL
ncbi:MAG: DUF5107 domain-containing protein [Clostridia bacterium]|nr:DUF5107 domain-containing protein [Clostridia bacterium]MBQ4624540.1 DUF5107 domain-containing protein [Clostridia bacterium]